MSDNSKIEWTDASFTPIRARNLKTGKVGWHCEHATTGCEFCYSEGFNKRLGTGLPFKPGHRGDIDIFLDEKMLLAPLRWKKPRKIFVCSMTDLFADFVKDEWIDKIFAVMALCPQHTFQVLTKRAERMGEYLTSDRCRFSIDRSVIELREAGTITKQQQDDNALRLLDRWPLPNVWLGVSAERQREADERIPLLLQTPAAVRFVSAEPLLGPINLKRIKVADLGWQDVLEGWRDCKDYPGRENILDWVIAGGESGPNARPMHPTWPRRLRDQCASGKIAYFFKQWGGWAPHDARPGGDLGGDVRAGRVRIVHPTGQSDVEVSIETGGRNTIPGSRYMERVGKKAAGRLLDGKTHDEFPQVSA